MKSLICVQSYNSVKREYFRTFFPEFLPLREISEINLPNKHSENQFIPKALILRTIENKSASLRAKNQLLTCFENCTIFSGHFG
jgi:hypothetical protein